MSTTTLEKCMISPPPATVGERSLPLNFFDAVWLLFFPIHQVFFYDFPHPTSYFLQSIVPNLKRSLSITLQHFSPFAGNLIIHPNPNVPEIRYVEGDSVAVTFAETGLDYDHLVSNHPPRECNYFYPLVPVLEPASKASDYVTIPLFAVQVTLFPGKGIAIGLTNHHSLCDATTRFNFLKAWTEITKHGTDESFLANGSLPVYDRPVYPSSLNQMYFNQPGIEAIDAGYQQPGLGHGETDGKVRATIVLTQANINRLKKWVLTQQPSLEYVSSFSVTCGYVWSCIAKSKSKSLSSGYGDDDLERFLCAVDWRSRMNPPLPETYFGNCVGPCISSPINSALLASNEGLLTAVEVFGKALSETLKDKDGLLKDAETWLERAFDPIPTIGVSGTPKVKVYEIDFGWGKPRKHETPSIDYNGSISVNAGKEAPGDVEIGICLSVKQMDAFLAISRDELERIFM